MAAADAKTVLPTEISLLGVALAWFQPGCKVLAAWSLRVGRVTRRQVLLTPDLPPEPLTGGGTILQVEHQSESASDMLTSLVLPGTDGIERGGRVPIGGQPRPGVIQLLLTGVVLSKSVARN